MYYLINTQIQKEGIILKKMFLEEIRKSKIPIYLSIIIMMFFTTLYTFFESGALYSLVMNIGLVVFLYLILYFSLEFKKEITGNTILGLINKFGGYNRYIIYKLITSVISTIIIFIGIIFYNYILNIILFEKGMETEIYNLILPLKTNIIPILQLILIVINMFVISYFSIIVIGNICKNKKGCILMTIAILLAIILYLFLRNFVGDIFPFYFDSKKMEIVRGSYTIEKNLLKLKYYIYYPGNKSNILRSFVSIFNLKKRNIATFLFTLISGTILYIKLIKFFRKNYIDQEYNLNR